MMASWLLCIGTYPMVKVHKIQEHYFFGTLHPTSFTSSPTPLPYNMKISTCIVTIAADVISSVSAQSGSLTNFTDCATYSTHLAVSSISLSPYPQCIGKQNCFAVAGNLSDPIIEGARLEVHGIYLGRTFYTDNKIVQELLTPDGQVLPIPAGPVYLNLCLILKPAKLANITFITTHLLRNGDGNILCCQTATLNATNCP
ncbi:MAG: hypothetical protein J3R72DRAFT_501245 [Linnemannia gamsii]|nr:MAG: hypothetical protein J3R72DRAFT_501245 [Linnemannia gamsii]